MSYATRGFCLRHCLVPIGIRFEKQIYDGPQNRMGVSCEGELMHRRTNRWRRLFRTYFKPVNISTLFNVRYFVP